MRLLQCKENSVEAANLRASLVNGYKSTENWGIICSHLLKSS